MERSGRAFEALESEIAELKEAINADNKENVTEEFGDLLFSCVNIARFIDVDSEEALNISTEKFIKRFLEVEKMAQERNIDMKSSTLEELDKLWVEAKKNLGSNRE